MGFFYIASNRRYRDKADVAQEETAFVACKCFGGWTDALARHQKGDTVMVKGRLRTEIWKSAFNSTSQPRFPSLCPKIESSSARNAGGVLCQHH
jgi:single-stranded DNA-binding protein